MEVAGMRRETNEYGVVLSYRDGALVGISEEEYIEVTKKHLKALFSSLRKKANVEDWAYEISVCPSVSNPRNLKKERLHIHICIRANPCTTIAKWVKDYWYKRFGIANMEKLYDYVTFRDGYMKAQAIYTWEQSKDITMLETSNEVVRVENSSSQDDKVLGSSLTMSDVNKSMIIDTVINDISMKKYVKRIWGAERENIITILSDSFIKVLNVICVSQFTWCEGG
jgi:hypothetical protein